jgi:hypothetical protein
VDGKEIDLGDAKLWEHIEAAQKKAAEDARRQHFLGRLELAFPQPDGAVGDGKKPATAPDAKIIVLGSDKVVHGIEVKSGKIIAQLDPANANQQLELRFTQLAQAKADPRIEELVKQAEAIKPGSGADIRKALQAVPKPAGDPKPKDSKSVKVGSYLLDTTAGKKVVILAIEDGKVLQLGEGDLKKYLDAGKRLNLNMTLPQPNADAMAHEIELMFLGNKYKTAEKKAAPTPPPADVEALSRQLERLHAELIELRKRLDAGKK